MLNLNMKILFLLVMFKLTKSTEWNEDFTDLTAYKGFPFGITCDQVYRLYGNEDDEDKAQCVILRDGEALLNETSTWKTLLLKGTFETADESWNGANITILLRWGDKLDQTRSFPLTVSVTDPVKFDCSKLKGESSSIKKGAVKKLPCSAPEGMRMSKSQYASITTVWYRDCVKIERNNPDLIYGEIDFTDAMQQGETVSFDNLVIRNASLRTTPGRYHCALKHGNRQLTVNPIHQICVCGNSLKNLPVIVAGQEKYTVAPGSSINITCSGQTGTRCDSLSQKVNWVKYKNSEVDGRQTKIRKCSSRMSKPYTMESNCSSILHKKYCEPLSAEDEAKDESKPDFTATFTIRDVKYSDSGVYACTIRTTKGQSYSNITVVVEKSLKGKANQLTIALAVVGGCIFFAVVLILLFHTYQTSILCFLKRYFVPYEAMDKKYITYLVYTTDVFSNVENNMLQDTYRYFGRLKNLVYDPNNSADQAGALIAGSVLETLKQCKTAVLFVTPQLLDIVNEEIYEIYQALQNNIENLNMSLVFVCTKQTRKRIIEQAGNGDNFCVMLKTFMRRKGNTVLLWKKKNQKAFSRALYVAMPKMKTRSPTTTQAEAEI